MGLLTVLQRELRSKESSEEGGFLDGSNKDLVHGLLGSATLLIGGVNVLEEGVIDGLEVEVGNIDNSAGGDHVGVVHTRERNLVDAVRT